MSYLSSSGHEEVVLRLGRDLTRVVKRGNPWVFADALRECPLAPPGTQAVLLDNKKGRPIARGFYDSQSPMAFRACEVDDDRPLNDIWARRRFESAWRLRQRLWQQRAVQQRPTTGFRLFNGEGDGVPGLVVDVYANVAVLKLDGPGPCGFWNSMGIAEWIAHEVGVTTVIERQRERGTEASALIGTLPTEPIEFLENGMRFTVDVLKGQKTGFFLDQRDNRWCVRDLATGCRLLNLFGYTGGFSIAAGTGGAKSVTTVDLAQPAIDAATTHWRLNGFSTESHEGVCADVFDFLTTAKAQRRAWDFVICDPPSFAPSKQSVVKASAAYQKLATESALVTARSGLLALASCSSHIDSSEFLRISEEGISQARRRATVLGLHGQPVDHPTPLALPEFRYLKFFLFQLDG